MVPLKSMVAPLAFGLAAAMMCRGRNADRSSVAMRSDQPVPCELVSGTPCPVGLICDAYRHLCVEPCSGVRCCDGVVCPPGTTCVPGTGRCGIAVGTDCHDMGEGWWTGRDIPHDAKAKPVGREIEVVNEGDREVFLRITWRQGSAFDIFPAHSDRPLDLPENHFCPTLCPATGPPLEVDCGRPNKGMHRLRPGGRVRLQWSGAEQVTVHRRCGDALILPCRTKHPTLPGDYALEVCTFAGASGGVPDDRDADLLLDATPAGEKQCARVAFSHPANNVVEVRIGR